MHPPGLSRRALVAAALARASGQTAPGVAATSAGVSAGLALALAARLRGPEYARTAQRVAEYAPQPPFRAGTPEEAGPAIAAAADIILRPLVEGARRALGD